MTGNDRPLRASLVTVGDELLLGRTVDTNAAWLGRALGSLGVPVARRATVADRMDEIQRAVAEAMEATELVLVTGGLGPTPDDLTRDAVAALLGPPLEEDREVMARIEALFRQRGVDEVPAPNRRVAQVPRGAVKLGNVHGTAPGLALTTPSALVVLLPGVPREMRGIFEGGLTELLAERFHGRLRPVHERVMHTTGIPESGLFEAVSGDLPPEGDAVSVAFLPHVTGVSLRLTAADLGPDEAAERLDAVQEALEAVVAPWRFHAPSGDLAEAVTAALEARGKTLSVAESCTGGLIVKRLTDLPGASAILAGGVVSYADDVKEGVLGVEGETLRVHGAVSEAVAREMVSGVTRLLRTEAGISVTGVAGPGGGSPDKPVGTVWYAAALDGTVVSRLGRFSGDRDAVRQRSAQAALFLLLRLLDGREG